MSDVVKTGTGTGTAVSNLDMNYFETYAAQVTQKQIVGRLLKFNKGDYLAGEDNEELPIGTKLAANMDQLMVGWIKWVDNKPEQQIMGLVVEGYKPPKRTELGDDNEELWEEDSQGKRRDPWQFSNYLLMKEPGSARTSDDELFTFALSSRGGLNAVGELCKVFGKEMRKRPDEYPIVELKVGAYDHPNKEFGRIKYPILEVVGWEKKNLFEQTEAKPDKSKGKAAAKPTAGKRK
jgi:hypothetical protein